MPRFAPFAGLRYDPARVEPGKVIAPPYDVVGPAERAALVARHSANAILVELPEPDPRSGGDRYAAAAARLAAWRSDGILVRDPSPSFYPYAMTAPDGSVTLGVLGELGLEPGSIDDVLPHEETLAKARSDRLELLEATRVNLSPIWGLSLASGLTGLLVSDRPPLAAAVDDDGVRHELWRVDDPAALDAVATRVGSAPVVVADGHHRLATALTYRGGTGDGTPGADGILALVVELSPDSLTVGPIHRVLAGLPDGLDLVDAFTSWFDVARAGDCTDRTAAALGESSAFALVTPGGCWLLSPRDGTPEAAGSDLTPSMVAMVLAELPDHELTFAHHWTEAVAVVASEEAQAAVLLPPVTVDQIDAWARARRRMPPKSTYFHPKPRTGMVFRTLDPD
jgi:uncharacterized protein (DUF1015 family)